jgi:superfamily II DNA/RNA helicase/translation elongation factor EF-1beta
MELIVKEMGLHQGDDKKSKLIPILRSGRFPDALKGHEKTIVDRQMDFSNEALTDIELFSYNTYFTMFPQLVAGIESDGSGFLNPIEIEGDYKAVEKVTDIPLPLLSIKPSQAQPASSNAGQTVNIPAEPVKGEANRLEFKYPLGSKIRIVKDDLFHEGVVIGYKDDISANDKYALHPNYQKLRVAYTHHGVQSEVEADKESLYRGYVIITGKPYEKLTQEPAKLPIGQSSKRHVEDLPNVVVRQVIDISDKVVAYMYGFHNGTMESMREVGNRITTEMFFHFPKSSHAASWFLITDFTGLPAFSMSPNLKVIKPVTSKQTEFYRIREKMQKIQDYEFNFSNISHNELGLLEREFIGQLRESGATGIENPTGFINGLRFKINDFRFLLIDNTNEFVLSSYGLTKRNDSHTIGTIDFRGHTATSAAIAIYDMALATIMGEKPEQSQRETKTTMIIPSSYSFNFNGIGHTTGKDIVFPAIETGVIAQLKKLGAENLWNKPRYDNSLIYTIDGHRIEMFFEQQEVKMNVTTSLTYAGAIQFADKSIEQLVADIDTLSKQHYTHRRFEKSPQYEPDFYYAPTAPIIKDVVTALSLGNTEVSASKMAILAQSLEAKKKKEQSKEKLPDTLSFDEVINLYNPGISKEEIQAWVWYKRQFGHPMKGWNKYYISNNKSGKKDAVVTSIETLELLDNRWQTVRSVAPGTMIGKKHSKEHSYRGITYWIVKNDQQEILFVDSSKVVVKDLSYFTEESEILKLVKARALVYIDGEYLPIPIYTFGNMYERERELEREKEYIIKEFGTEYFDWVKGLIKDNKPPELRIESKDKSSRPKILCVSKFAVDITQFGIKELADDTGIVLPNPKRRGLSKDDPENQYSLQEAFVAWLDIKTDNDVVGSNKLNILNYYIGNKRFPEDTSEEQQSQIRANARIACEELFSEFLATGLLYGDQQKVNRIWNETFNAFGAINKYKVPVGFTCSRTFKNNLLSIKPVQREGVAFMAIVGAGCLAYDVGVGKTLSAIITLAQAVQTGTCSRPVVVVPKPTYHKWKRELFGYWTDGAKKADVQFKNSTFVTGLLSGTDIKLNDWQNLSTKIVAKLGDTLEKKIPENTITLLTYEGLSQIGFSSKVYDSIFSSLVDILNNGGAEKSARDKAIDYSKYELMMGKGLKKTVADIDLLGLDYIVVDEAHNFKNVFDAVGKDKEDKRRMLFGLKGAQSERAIKLFFHTNYIQRTYGTNVMLLTATPFTNSPLEIFSMFSFIGYESLRKYNLQNIRRFFETFVLESVEYTVSLREEIVAKPVIKAFNNKQVLQKLLYNHFDYKTGEDAGVVRPCKVNLPLLKEFKNGQLNELSPDKQITTYLDMTEHQINNQKDVVDEASKNPFESPGAMFRAMAKSLDNALSPHIFESKIPQSDLTAETFVNESPKIKYVVECIKSVKEYHQARKEPVSGQVIYSNRGKEYFPLLKQYLEDYIGYQKRVEFGDVRLDEVEIIESGLPEAKKDNIKEGFLSGVVKVIIGTATIKEGVDLQNVGTVLYNLYPDWNPTDLKQLEGRIHRQGNQFGFVRIVMPLVVNSMDVFVFQKLEEKTARINSIWYKADKGNTLEMDSIDVEEIKYALIDNPQELARMKLGKELAQAQKEISLAEENQKMYRELKSLIHYYNTYRGRLMSELETKLNKFKAALSNGKQKLDSYSTSGHTGSEADKKEKRRMEEMVEKIARIVERMEAFLLSVPQDDKDLLEIIRSVNQSNWGEGVYMQFDSWTTNQFRENFSQVKKAEKQILFARNLTIGDDLSELKALLEAEVKSKTLLIEDLRSDEYWQQLLQGVVDEMAKRASVRGEMHEQIAKFKKLNLLLSYKSDNVDKDVCALPEVECCGFNPDSQVINQIEYRNSDGGAHPYVVEVETKRGIEKIPTEEVEPLSIEDEVEPVELHISTQQELAEGIEALQVLLEMAVDETETNELKEAIETLEILIDMEQEANSTSVIASAA